jgi:hypothetical protein
MTSDDKVIPLHPYSTIEIDDTRLQAMWRSHNYRRGLLYGALGLAGITGVLLALAAIVWAVMSGSHPAPQIKVNVQPPNVTVNVPKQPAPVVNNNITVPQPQQRPADPQPATRTEGGIPIVTEYVTFQDVYLGNIEIQTGWQYRKSGDPAPYHQWCHAWISATTILQVGIDGHPNASLAKDAQALNLSEAQAQALLKQCQWYPG